MMVTKRTIGPSYSNTGLAVFIGASNFKQHIVAEYHLRKHVVADIPTSR